VLPSSSAIVLSDYAKGVLSESVCKVVIAEARGLGIPVLVDPKSSTCSSEMDVLRYWISGWCFRMKTTKATSEIPAIQE
jgi:hypothetical protein